MLAGSGSFLSVESRSILCKAIAIGFGQWPLAPMRRFLPAVGQIGQYAYGRSVAVNISTHCKATEIGLVQRCSALMARSLLVGVMIRQYAYGRSAKVSASAPCKAIRAELDQWHSAPMGEPLPAVGKTKQCACGMFI